MSANPSVLDLAESIAGPAHYKFDELIEGIREEQLLLGANPYLTILWQQVLDYDGLTDWLYLGDGFSDLNRAHAFIEDQIASLLREHTAPGQPHSHDWRADPDRQGAYVPQASSGEIIRVCGEQTLTLTADAYNRVYFRAQVLGRFPGTIIGSELFASLAETRHDLWSCLLDIGEARRDKKMRRTPSQISGG